MSDFIRATEKQARRYWTEDGLPDLYLGFGMILYGALTWWSARSGTGLAELVRTVFLLTMIFAGRFILEKAKMRITYPRTGYVAYNDHFSRRELALRLVLAFFIASALALIMTYVFSSRGVSTGMTLINLLVPLGFGLIWAMVAYQQASLRFGIYALVATLSGLASIPFARSLPSTDQSAMLNGVPIMFVTGIAMLIGGALTLFTYLRRHPQPQEGEA